MRKNRRSEPLARRLSVAAPLALVLGFFAALEAPAQPLDFRAPRLIHSGPRSAAITAGELTGDGFLDVVAASGVLTLFAGDGSGGFAPRPPLLTGRAFADVMISDFDADGVAGVAACDDAATGGFRVVVLRGDGRGRFATTWDRQVGAGPSSPFALRAADFDENGVIDLVVAEERHDANVVLLGDGRGGFAVGPTLAADPRGTATRGLVTGDFDADGHDDVLSLTAASRDGRPRTVTLLSLVRGDGAGGFAAPQVIAAGLIGPLRLDAADVDRDGDSDVAVTSDGLGGVPQSLRSSSPRAGARSPRVRSPGWRRSSASRSPIWTPTTISTSSCRSCERTSLFSRAPAPAASAPRAASRRTNPSVASRRASSTATGAPTSS